MPLQHFKIKSILISQFSIRMSPIVHSMRLRTLPLSLAGVILGIFLSIAYAPTHANALTIVLILLTTICLQILTNLSNELGDYLSGTDGEGREGPTYSLAEGKITIQDFKKLIVVFAILCALFGTAMIWSAFGTFFALKPAVLLLLGACAIWAAIRYMLGKNSYGSKGLGDISVFIFFGLVSVLGSYFVMAQSIDNWIILLPACAIGLFSVGVLNVNNIRDMESDRGKRMTIPLRIGEKKAKNYQALLIYGGLICIILFNIFSAHHCFFWTITLIPFNLHVKGVFEHSGHDLDKYLPMLVLTTFALSIILGIEMIVSP